MRRRPGGIVAESRFLKPLGRCKIRPLCSPGEDKNITLSQEEKYSTADHERCKDLAEGKRHVARRQGGGPEEDEGEHRGLEGEQG